MNFKKTFIASLALLIAGVGAAFADDPGAYDPIEPFNRGVFWFNDKFDVYLLEPVSDGYDYVVPDSGQIGVTNFFRNLRYPTYLVSDVLQLKFEQALEHTGRFLINTTVGLLGFVDVAKDVGLPDVEEDFGLVFARYGIPAGPYIVLPFFGPSNARDAVGLVFDTVTNPTYWIGAGNTGLHSDAEFWIPAGLTTVKTLQLRVNFDDAISAAKEGSLDYYLFMQSAYYQYRDGLISGKGEPKNDKLHEETDIDKDLDAILEQEK